VLTPAMRGAVSVFQLTTEGAEELGETIVGPDATFSFGAPGLEMQSWKGGRLVIQVRSTDGKQAEGFVSVAAFAEITRRAGALAPRLLAILTGTETPADVAAIMSWFHEDPRRLAGTIPMTIGGGADKQEEDNRRGRTIAVSELNSIHAVPLTANLGTETSEAASWKRFMDHVFAAFRERRGPFGRTAAGRTGQDEDDDDFAEVWERVQKARTFGEQIRAYLSALETSRPSTEYGDWAPASNSTAHRQGESFSRENPMLAAMGQRGATVRAIFRDYRPAIKPILLAALSGHKSCLTTPRRYG
jgi:hypothetical protein